MQILEKMMNPSRKDLTLWLIDVLWAYNTTFKILLGISPCKLVYGKACNLPIKIEWKAYWMLKIIRLHLNSADPLVEFQLNELDELRCDTYENVCIFKDKMKTLHNQHISRHTFKPSDKVVLYESRLHLFSEKLHSR